MLHLIRIRGQYGTNKLEEFVIKDETFRYKKDHDNVSLCLLDIWLKGIINLPLQFLYNQLVVF